MRRREFSQIAALCGTALTLGGAAAPALAQAPAIREGKDYLRLSRPAPVDAPTGKVEVIEFFGYWCPHCASFEPAFEAWQKKMPAHIALRHIPVAFRDDNVPLQRLYYVLEAMGKVDELHGKVFTAIHGEKLRLNNQDAIADWVSRQGVDKAKFLEHYNGFTVASKLRRAKQVFDAYQVDGVPSFGVAGLYYTSGSEAGSMERALRVVEQLAEASRKG